jgi:hypothetical protein
LSHSSLNGKKIGSPAKLDKNNDYQRENNYTWNDRTLKIGKLKKNKVLTESSSHYLIEKDLTALEIFSLSWSQLVSRQLRNLA